MFIQLGSTMLIIDPGDPAQDALNRANDEQRLIESLTKRRILWNILMGTSPAVLFLISILLRYGLELEGSVDAVVSFGTIGLQAISFGISLWMYKRYARQIEQSQTRLHEFRVAHTQAVAEEKRNTDVA